jgi:hypothetical protein
MSIEPKITFSFIFQVHDGCVIRLVIHPVEVMRTDIVQLHYAATITTN